MEDDCVVLGNFSKKRKIDDTINIIDEAQESTQIQNKIKKPKKKKKKIVRCCDCECKTRKHKTDSSTTNTYVSSSSNSHFKAFYLSDGINYSISETEIHHLENGVKVASRGVNTDTQPISNTTRSRKHDQRLPGIQVSTELQKGLSNSRISNEILDLSNGLVLNELQNMGETDTARILEPYVPNDYIDLKGKGKS